MKYLIVFIALGFAWSFNVALGQQRPNKEVTAEMANKMAEEACPVIASFNGDNVFALYNVLEPIQEKYEDVSWPLLLDALKGKCPEGYAKFKYLLKKSEEEPDGRTR